MTLCRCITAAFCLLTLPAQADETRVIDGLPAGVIIYDSAAPPATVPAYSQPGVLVANPTPVLAPLTQSLASTRSSFAQPIAGQPVQIGTPLSPSAVAPQVNLAPGETILQAIVAPSAIVRIPNPEPAYTLTSGPPPADERFSRVAPEPVVDPVTGRLRDTAGWTGRTEGPASIGCFPAGACAVLNQR